MQLSSKSQIAPSEQKIVSYWKLGRAVTAGRWYNIFRAKPKSLGEESSYDYVIKMVNPHLKTSQLQYALDRLGREAIATEQIVHSNVIRLLDAELDRAPFFLVQPWMPGSSFDRFQSCNTQTTLNRLVWVARQVAEAMHAGHEMGRVHLGLDPSHVLLGRTGRVTMIGWSQSHPVGELAWMPHDQLQLAMYTAPECFHTSYRADFASDVYSLGALIYKALSRRVPFDGQSVKSVAEAAMNTATVDLMIKQPLCPSDLYRLVRKMLDRNPAKRPSMRSVLESLIAIEIEHLTDPTLIAL